MQCLQSKDFKLYVAGRSLSADMRRVQPLIYRGLLTGLLPNYHTLRLQTQS